MHVQVHTDNHVHIGAKKIQEIGEDLQGDLSRYGSRITGIEVFLSDENGPKGGEDKRCLIEARVAGHSPIVASHSAGGVDEALDGASEKLLRGLEHTLGRLHDPKGRVTSFGGDQEI
ncbi:HPF/RaiA family ribosome-associated protein [Tundrisphaera sp. TA3]|uniref:HPF/RaiA family ribosome-associated protein n=1 Tax=Tundrisphaera sp. TA3 TaxID=3435775 RepID=UPI003EB7D2E0